MEEITSKVIMKRSLRFIIIISAAVLVFSCSSSRKYEEEERDLIEQYLSAHHLKTAPDANGLYSLELFQGIGDRIEVGDSVGVFYKMKYLDGTEVYSNNDETTPLRFRVGTIGMIDGWTIGLTYMKKGGKAVFLIPSDLAYGPMGYGYYGTGERYVTVVPGYTPLLYEIEVVEHIKKSN